MKNFNKSSARGMSKIEIFLDMDGVISDFDRHCTETGMRKVDGTPNYNGMNTVEWYSNMAVFDGARKFYDNLQTRGHVRFLTAPIKFPECFSGKAEWILKFVPERGRMILGELMIVASKDKHLVAKPNRVLIDDSEKNIKEWIAAGGIGILHTGDYAATLKELDIKIKAFQKTTNLKAPLKP